MSRIIDHSNIHSLSLREQLDLQTEAEDLGLDWTSIAQIEIIGSKKVYKVFLVDENARRFLDGTGVAAHEMRTFKKGIEVFEQ